MNIVVLGGGDSPEREVSLRSSKAVSAAAREAGFSVQEFDPAGGLAFLDSIVEGTIIFPILHGKGGEDGVIQAELESRALPYLGSDSSSSARCFDKWLTRSDLQKNKIPLPRGSLVTKDDYSHNPMSLRPHVLKIVRGGSSIGTLIARDPANVKPEAVDAIFALDSHAVLEELIVGQELTVPILGSSALTPIEIKPPSGAEFDYENKYNGATAEICPPENISDYIQKEAQNLAEKVHSAMKCRHLSRVDMMIDASGKVFVLEINTIPGLTDQSLYPKSAAVSGLPMPKLVEKFAELVKRDFQISYAHS